MQHVPILRRAYRYQGHDPTKPGCADCIRHVYLYEYLNYSGAVFTMGCGTTRSTPTQVQSRLDRDILRQG